MKKKIFRFLIQKSNNVFFNEIKEDQLQGG